MVVVVVVVKVPQTLLDLPSSADLTSRAQCSHSSQW
jgi:hypothetical protein